MKKNMKKNKKKNKAKNTNDIVLGELAVASDEPIEGLGRDEAGGALVAALQEAARLGVRVAVGGDGYTILHGREEKGSGNADLSGVVVRRTLARRERAAATGIAQRRRPNAVAP
jgi:hypothetical protein